MDEARFAKTDKFGDTTMFGSMANRGSSRQGKGWGYGKGRVRVRN